mmetsp:Transcript_16448/g.27031  ORF Transcript_16448/g.27031 Transcript_16448/m.27031 type:complete len:289 (+) Transcript_16448:1618-2484(+)
MAKSNWYAVAKGRSPGIYQTWDECKANTAGFSGAIFKTFKTREEALAFMSTASAAAVPATAVPSLAATPSKAAVLTPEQRMRIEENRKRALKIRQMKMTPSPRQQLQQPEVVDLTPNNDTEMNNKKRARAPEPSAAKKRPPRHPTDHDDIDYEDMEDSLRFQLDVAPIYGEPSSGGKASSEEDTTEEVGDELQMKAIQLASDGENMFLTGKAGTGKSWVTKKIVSTFHTKLGKNIHVTAPTGIAAINVGGVTINSWGNYHLGSYFEDFDRMWEKLNACLSCHFLCQVF